VMRCLNQALNSDSVTPSSASSVRGCRASPTSLASLRSVTSATAPRLPQKQWQQLDLPAAVIISLENRRTLSTDKRRLRLGVVVLLSAAVVQAVPWPSRTAVRAFSNARPAKNASLFNVPQICPEPVLVN